MGLPSFTIVTCSFQQARFLGAAMDSVIAQKYKELEYIVIDGGSYDNSVELIKSRAKNISYWESTPDRGQTDALIKGFEKAKGDLLGWLCSDDLLLPNALQKVGQFFADNPQVDFVYGDALWIDIDGKLIRPKVEMNWHPLICLFDHNYLPQPSCFWRRRLYERVGGLNACWNLSMDADLWLRFSLETDPIHLTEFLSCMRMYPAQKTKALRTEALRELAEMRAQYASILSGAPLWLTSATSRIARIVMKAAAGGYFASVPMDLRLWLEQHSTDLAVELQK